MWWPYMPTIIVASVLLLQKRLVRGIKPNGLGYCDLIMNFSNVDNVRPRPVDPSLLSIHTVDIIYIGNLMISDGFEADVVINIGGCQ